MSGRVVVDVLGGMWTKLFYYYIDGNVILILEGFFLCFFEFFVVEIAITEVVIGCIYGVALFVV